MNTSLFAILIYATFLYKEMLLVDITNRNNNWQVIRFFLCIAISIAWGNIAMTIFQHFN